MLVVIALDPAYARDLAAARHSPGQLLSVLVEDRGYMPGHNGRCEAAASMGRCLHSLESP